MKETDRRPVHDPDEDAIRGVMSLDIPAYARQAQIIKDSATLDTETVIEPVIALAPNQEQGIVASTRSSQGDPVSKPPVRRKQQEQDYKSLFLHRNPVRDREVIYIHRHIIDSIRGYIGVVGPRISITAYINNILEHHLKFYENEIDDLYAASVLKKAINIKKE